MNRSVEDVPAKSGVKLAAGPPGWWPAWRGIWMLTWRSRLAVRQLGQVLLLLTAIPVAVHLALTFEDQETYFDIVVRVYLLLVVPLYCLTFFGAMLRDELQAATIGFLLSRPISRARLCVLKYLTGNLWVQLVLLVNCLLLLVVGSIHSVEGLIPLGIWLWLTQALSVCAYGALSALLGLISKRYIVLGIIYGFVVEVGIGRIPTNIHTLAISHHLQTLMANVPQVKEAMGWDPERTVASVLVLVVATVIFLGLAMVLFTFREYHHNEEMQK